MSFLQDLDSAVSRGSVENRMRALWYATDLLLAGRYSEDEIWIFGEVIGRLAQEIEVAARAQLAIRLARTDNAPINIIHKLAFDSSIEVAGPVLRQSGRLDTQALVANARTKSQQHLLAISQRTSINDQVTDVLVTRGDRSVINSVAKNSGARFSDFGFLHMIKRSENDSILAEQLGLRRDIPRHLFQQLIAKASEDVKRQLVSERPELASQVKALVTDLAGALHAKLGPATRDYFAAKRVVTAQHRHGNLNEAKILEYARSHKFEEATVGLSLLCILPVDVTERALMHKNSELTLILAKALDFSWETTMSLIFLGAPDHRISQQQLENSRREFDTLNVDTSRDILKLYQTRKHEAAAGSEERRLPQLHGI